MINHKLKVTRIPKKKLLSSVVSGETFCREDPRLSPNAPIYLAFLNGNDDGPEVSVWFLCITAPCPVATLLVNDPKVNPVVFMVDVDLNGCPCWLDDGEAK